MIIDSPYVVRPGKKFALDKVDTRDDGKFDSKEEGVAAAQKRLAKLPELQERLYAEATQSLLIVLQALDTGGKDGTIDHVFTRVNPQGCSVTPFKAPSTIERAHDYLWRVHAACPARGMIGILNRSHYEDVLVPVVKGWIANGRAKQRYRQINDFERMLVEEGTTIVKIMLHISKDEQKERLIARQEDPAKHWKFDPGDVETRRDWDKYQAAYERLLNECSTEHAPWYVVPADRKWYRNYVVSDLIVKALEQMDPKYPKVSVDPRTFKIV